MKTFRTLIQSGLSMMLLLGTATLFTGQAHAQFSSPIHDIDNAARQPVVFQATVDFNAGSNDSGAGRAVAFTVPAGKRLVIETISGQIFVPTGQQVTITVGAQVGGSEAFYFLPFDSKLANDPPNNDTYIGTFSVRIYADAGNSVFLDVHRSSSQGDAQFGIVTFSGYLVNLH
jgi:hypothetical protein